MMPNRTGIETKPRILFFITEDWYFWIHWLTIARGARDAGFEVLIATRVNQHKELIEKEGFKLIPVGLVRRGMNIFREALSVQEVVRIYQKERPDIVHQFAIKPILYGSLAAKLSGVPYVVNTLAGLGIIFVEQGKKAAIIRQMAKLAYRTSFYSGNNYGLFQNPDDLKLFVDTKIIKPERTILIRGVGINTSKFRFLPEPNAAPTIMLASRMLWNKGVGELVEAGELLRKESIECRIVLVGIPDPENPMSIPEETLQAWDSEGIIEWWGYQEDMPKIISQANIVVLPTTYGEGVPTILLEAASCGRAVVATDVPGCREIVRHKENGFLVPPKAPESLAKALKTLIKDAKLRKTMGIRGREMVEEEFSEEIVVKQTMEVYRRLLDGRVN